MTWLTRERYYRFLIRLSAKREVHGIQVAVVVGWIVKDDTDRQIAVLTEALGLIQATSPERYRRLQRDFQGILILGAPHIYGRFLATSRWCELTGDWLLAPETTAAAVACVLIHEATHAHLHRIGVEYPAGSRAQIERICHKAERNFALRLPRDLGEPLIDVLETRLDLDETDFSDETVRQRELKALESLGLPNWLMRFIRGRRAAA
jgi:hypothetical protein